MERLKEVITKFMKAATPTQKLMLGGFILAGLIIMGVVVSLATRTSYAALYSGLKEEDAAQIVGKLKEQKVEYRLAGGGGTIEVPTDKVYETRLALAEAGLPKGGSVGFELFDGTHVGLTQVGERVNYQRALQGELERTISEIESVDSARVHIVLPEQKLYSEEETRPSASVVLKLKGGNGLSKKQVRGIVNLVASAAEGLSTDDVKVLDTSGVLLSELKGPDGEEMTGGNSVMGRLQMAREFEHQTEQKVQSMLDEVAGPGKAVVRISATMDFDNRETEKADYQPATANSGKGVLEKQQEKTETYNGRAFQLAAGVPGTSSNLGIIPPKTATGTDGFTSTEVNNTYQVSKTLEHSKSAPGQVKRLSVALFVDESLGGNQLQAVKNAAAAAAGIDPARGDQIVVESLPFAQPDNKAEQVEKAAKAKELYVTIGRDIAAIILLLIFLFFARSLFKAGKAAVEEKLPQLPPLLPELNHLQTVPAGVAAAAYPAAAFAGQLRDELAPESQAASDEQPDEQLAETIAEMEHQLNAAPKTATEVLAEFDTDKLIEALQAMLNEPKEG